MNEYHVMYWSPCGSIEMTIDIINARTPEAAIKKFTKRYEHSDLTIHYECYESPLIRGTMK